MEPGPDQYFAETGAGVPDRGAIFPAAEAAGMRRLVVEQDGCRRPVFESIALSYQNLQRIGAI